MYAKTPLGDDFQVTYACEILLRNDGKYFSVVTIRGDLYDMARVLQAPRNENTYAHVTREAIDLSGRIEGTYTEVVDLGVVDFLEAQGVTLDAIEDDAKAVARWGRFFDAQPTYSDA